MYAIDHLVLRSFLRVPVEVKASFKAMKKKA